MKKLLILAGLFLSMAFVYAMDKGTWTGYISDSNCGADGAKEGHEACAIKCVKGGASPVFVVDKKVYKISDPKEVMDFLGKKVTITGDMTEDVVTVEKIEKADN